MNHHIVNKIAIFINYYYDQLIQFYPLEISDGCRLHSSLTVIRYQIGPHDPVTFHSKGNINAVSYVIIQKEDILKSIWGKDATD